MTNLAHSINTDAATKSLLNFFGFALFSRLSARHAGLEDAVRLAELEGRARFVRCAGVSSGMPYQSENEMFRMLA